MVKFQEIITGIERRIAEITAELARQEKALDEKRRLVEEQQALVAQLDENRKGALDDIESAKEMVKIYTPTTTQEHLAQAKSKMDLAFKATLNLQGCSRHYIEDKKAEYESAKKTHAFWVQALREAEKKLEGYKDKVEEAKRAHRAVNLKYEIQACGQLRSNFDYRKIKSGIDRLTAEKAALEKELERQTTLAIETQKKEEALIREAKIKEELKRLRDQADVRKAAIVDLSKRHDAVSDGWADAFHRIDGEFTDKFDCVDSEFDVYLFSLVNAQNLDAGLPAAPGGPGGMSAADLHHFRSHSSQLFHARLDVMKRECEENSAACRNIAKAFETVIEPLDGILAKITDLKCEDIKESKDLAEYIQTILKSPPEPLARQSLVISRVTRFERLKDSINQAKARLVKEEAQYAAVLQQARTASAALPLPPAQAPSMMTAATIAAQAATAGAASASAMAAAAVAGAAAAGDVTGGSAADRKSAGDGAAIPGGPSPNAGAGAAVTGSSPNASASGAGAASGPRPKPPGKGGGSDDPPVMVRLADFSGDYEHRAKEEEARRAREAAAAQQAAYFRRVQEYLEAKYQEDKKKKEEEAKRRAEEDRRRIELARAEAEKQRKLDRQEDERRQAERDRRRREEEEREQQQQQHQAQQRRSQYSYAYR